MPLEILIFSSVFLTFWVATDSHLVFDALERRWLAYAYPDLAVLGLEGEAPRLFTLSVGSAVAGLFLGTVLWGLAEGFLLMVLVGTAYAAYLRLRVRNYTEKLDRQLPSALDAMASALRAGRSLQQAVQWVGEEGVAPLRNEFQRFSRELALGKSLEEGLDDLSSRIGTAPFRNLSMTVGPLRQMGANLIPALEGMAEILRRRERTAEKLSSLTAQAKAQLWVMGLLAPGLVAVLYAMEPALISRLFQSSDGHVFILLAVVLEVMAVLLAKRFLDPKRVWQ